MLSFTQKPKVVSQSEGITTKVVQFFGSDEAINEVARQRGKDHRCHQLPRQESIAPHHVRVVYTIDEDGFVRIELVRVSFDQGRPEHWSCFYDAPGDRKGKKDSPHGHFMYYFLDDFGHLDGITKLVYKYEERQALRQIVRRGPGVFPKDSEIDEATVAPSDIPRRKAVPEGD